MNVALLPKADITERDRHVREGWSPTFAHLRDWARGVNEGDVVRLCNLLRARRERP